MFLLFGSTHVVKIKKTQESTPSILKRITEDKVYYRSIRASHRATARRLEKRKCPPPPRGGHFFSESFFKKASLRKLLTLDLVLHGFFTNNNKRNTLVNLKQSETDPLQLQKRPLKRPVTELILKTCAKEHENESFRRYEFLQAGRKHIVYHFFLPQRTCVLLPPSRSPRSSTVASEVVAAAAKSTWRSVHGRRAGELAIPNND